MPTLRCPVNVLLARRSAAEAALAAELLRRDGFVVEATTEASALVRLCATTPFDVVVIDSHLADASGLEALRLVRGRRTLRGAAVFVTTDPPDDAVRAQVADLGVRRVLLNPLSLLDLGELLGELPAGPEAAPGAAPRLGPLAELSTWWRERRSGVVHVARPAGTAWVLLSDGAPLDEEGLGTLTEGLADAELLFEPCEVDAAVDPPDLGAALWQLAWAAAGAEGPPATSRLLMASGATQELCRLPLDPHTVAVLRMLDGPTSVRRIAERLGDPWEEVERTASALAMLGLVDLAEAAPPAALRRGAPRPPPPPERENGRTPPEAPARVGEVTRFGRDVPAREEPVTAPRPAGPGAAAHGPAPTASFGPAAVSFGPAPRASFGPAPLPRLGPAPAAPPATPVHRAPPDARPGPADPRPSPADADTDPVARPAADTRSPATLVQALSRELRVLEANDDWTALAAPAGSPPELVAAAHARMTARYAPLRGHRHPEVAALATRVAAHIDEAAARLRGNGGSAAPTLDAQLRVGRALVDRADWARAERHFERLREGHPDSPDPLAWLGWVRFHDPARTEAERAEEGRASLELALLFAPAHRDGNLFLAEISLAEGDPERAGRHLDRVLQAEPTNAQALKLLRRVDEARRAAARP